MRHILHLCTEARTTFDYCNASLVWNDGEECGKWRFSYFLNKHLPIGLTPTANEIELSLYAFVCTVPFIFNGPSALFRLIIILPWTVEIILWTSGVLNWVILNQPSSSVGGWGRSQKPSCLLVHSPVAHRRPGSAPGMQWNNKVIGIRNTNTIFERHGDWIIKTMKKGMHCVIFKASRVPFLARWFVRYRWFVPSHSNLFRWYDTFRKLIT